VQVEIIPVADRHLAAAKKIAGPLAKAGIRVRVANNSDTVGYKIRRAEKEKIPYMIVFGDKEKKAAKLPIRVRGSAKLKLMSAASLQKTVLNAILKKR